MEIINHYLQVAAKEQSQKVFIMEGERAITFAQLDEVTNNLATNLIRLGLHQGDRIGLLAANQSEWLMTFFAAAKVGLTVVPLSPRFRESELTFIIQQSNVKCLVSMNATADFDFAQFFEHQAYPSVEHYIFLKPAFEGTYVFEELCQNSDIAIQHPSQVKPEDVAIIIYTSGTTGKPKGSLITHKSILAGAKAQVEHMQITAQDKFLQSLPLNHVGGITCQVMAGLIAHAELVMVPVFNPPEVLQLIDKHQITIFGGVPTMYFMLFGQPTIKAHDLSAIRYAIVGGSNADSYLLQGIKSYIPAAKIINLYGLSESSGPCILSKLDAPEEKQLSTLGVMIGDFEAKVVDSELQEVAFDEVGELLIKGDCLSKGYDNDEENTAQAFRGDWLHTGDMVTMDQEGFITFKGRKKEIYIQAGFNVFPAEVEEVLIKHPAVQLVSGIGVPDPFYGEVGCYFIVRKPNEEVTVEELLAYCQEQLADYKVPKKIIFAEQLPMTPAGKIQKASLKVMYEQVVEEANS